MGKSRLERKLLKLVKRHYKIQEKVSLWAINERNSLVAYSHCLDDNSINKFIENHKKYMLLCKKRNYSNYCGQRLSQMLFTRLAYKDYCHIISKLDKKLYRKIQSYHDELFCVFLSNGGAK